MRAYSIDIEHEAETNDAFRKVLFTGTKLQLVAMSLRPGEDIGSEVHPDTDQFFRIEEGQARLELDEGVIELDDDSVAIVPAGTRHNVVNASVDKDLKLYTIYAPPQHPEGAVFRTKEEAEAGHPVPA